ncbi:cell division control protein 6 homolog [Gigantopelta aegis]|uniref:cell division control protein 6 homolog n=1 Tax=Gigantopelta aegis TaxID=1735272 RepID=UPI001B8889D0|nr:cell division control protein 6 homolog [Gigantopelta aegis]
MAAVQRKLEFKVRKSSRIQARVKCDETKESISENHPQISPRKRQGDDWEISLSVKPLSCSPHKKQKELRILSRETPIKTSLTCRFKPDDTDCDTSTKSGLAVVGVKPIPTPKTPVKCNSTNREFTVISPYKSPKRTLGFQRLITSPVKSPCLSLKKLSLNSPLRCHSPVKSVLNSSEQCRSPVKSSLIAPHRSDSPVKSSLKFPQECRSPVKSSLNSLQPCQSPVKSFIVNQVADSLFSEKENTPKKKVVVTDRKSVSMLKLQRVNSSAYSETKQVLHTAKPEQLHCREKEVGEIQSFLEGHLKNQTAGSMYISGAPGTGKTASLLHIIDILKRDHSCKMSYLNCMMLKDSAAVFKTLHEQLTGRKLPSNKDVIKYMEKCVTASTKSLIIVLDEIDQLDSKHQEVLYTIFEWPSLPKSKLILVGVANALDFTDRILPRLQAKPKCRPKLVNYAPYSKDQIVTIINNRLKQLQEDGLAVIEPSAIQFCARKISAVAGDMRKALDVCRRSVELVEQDIRSQQVLKVSECNSPSKKRAPVPKKITVHHISRIMSEVYGSSVKTSSSQETIPLQQKLMLCSLLLLVKNGKTKEVGLGKFHETYCKICRKRKIAVIDQSEFFSLCSLLEARGMMGVRRGKETRLAKIILKLDEKELEHTLQDRVLMSSMLYDGLPK